MRIIIFYFINPAKIKILVSTSFPFCLSYLEVSFFHVLSEECRSGVLCTCMALRFYRRNTMAKANIKSKTIRRKVRKSRKGRGHSIPGEETGYWFHCGVLWYKGVSAESPMNKKAGHQSVFSISQLYTKKHKRHLHSALFRVLDKKNFYFVCRCQHYHYLWIAKTCIVIIPNI